MASTPADPKAVVQDLGEQKFFQFFQFKKGLSTYSAFLAYNALLTWFLEERYTVIKVLL